MKVLSNFMRDQLQDELDCIDQRLRVSPNIEMVLRAVDKEFSLCANYPKGHGEIFGKWMSKNHPGTHFYMWSVVQGLDKTSLLKNQVHYIGTENTG